MKLMVKLFVCLIAIIVGSGCATVVRGTKQQIAFTSEPSGARVRLADGQEGITPQTFPIKKKLGEVPFTISKDGYQEVSGTLSATASGWGVTATVANGVFGTGGVLIGLPIDLVTKSYRNFDRNSVHVALSPLRSPVAFTPPPAPPPPQEPPQPPPSEYIPTPSVERTRIIIRYPEAEERETVRIRIIPK